MPICKCLRLPASGGNYTNKARSSFTLIELLVVLALVAILSVVVVMTLNPAELLKQARDSTRLSDLATVNTALNLFSTDVINGFMGTSTIVYTSLVNTVNPATTTCAGMGLPTLPTGWNYNCPTSTQSLRNTDGTGWIPVNFQRISSNTPISQLPVDPTNTTSSNLYYTYVTGGSWKLTTILEAQKNLSTANLDGGTAPAAFEMGNDLSLGSGIFPSGWVKVPGNSTFDTSDFWVMKYEAKCVDASAPGVGLIAPANGTVYYDSQATCTGSRNIASLPGGYSIAQVTQISAISYCQNIGAHLITNNEWQTIAWNVENVSANWNGGVVGSSYMYSGHNDGVPSGAQIASTDDNDGYYNTGNTSGGQRRTLILSNGQVIWDMSANLYEWTNDTIIGSNQPYSGVAGWQYREYPAVTNWGTMSQQTAGPSNPAWSATQWIGRLHSWDGSTDANVYAFLRGGVFYVGQSAGIEALHLAVAPTSKHFYYGFRCVK